MVKLDVFDLLLMVNLIKNTIDFIYNDANTFMNRKYYNARTIRNGSWKDPKFGEPASGIPSQANEGVTT